MKVFDFNKAALVNKLTELVKQYSEESDLSVKEIFEMVYEDTGFKYEGSETDIEVLTEMVSYFEDASEED